MRERNLNKREVLAHWETRWGPLGDNLKDKFLHEQPYVDYLREIIKFREHQIVFCINKEKKLVNILALLNLKYGKSRGRAPIKIGKDAKRRCKICYKVIDSGSYCEECSVMLEINAPEIVLGDLDEAILYEIRGTVNASWPSEPIFESHNTQRTCPNCDSWLDDRGNCECKRNLQVR